MTAPPTTGPPRRRAPRPGAARAAKRGALAATLVAGALALGACGDSHTRVTTGTYAGESGQNAPYLDVGPLIYEVQLSRELNPVDTEDRAYLTGLPAPSRRLNPGEEWFAVFMQVYNETERSHPASTSVVLSDTQGHAYWPVAIAPTNEFAYRGGAVPSKGRIPALDTVAANGPTQGALLLYKIKLASLDNRPLELRIVDPRNPSKTASAELDV